MPKGWLGPPIALMTIAVACTGGDDDASSNRGTDYAEAIADLMWVDRLSGEQNECIAQSFVEAVGLDELRDRTPDEIREFGDVYQLNLDVDRQEREAFGNGMKKCINLREFFLDSATDQGPDVVDCTDQNVNEEFLEAFALTVYVDGERGASENPELLNDMAALFDRCDLPIP